MTETTAVPDRASPGRAGIGLTAREVAERVARGEVNNVPDAPSRTISEIVRSNLFTRFNALIGGLFAIVMACGAYRDGLFGGVIVANTAIGIIQELRAKHTLDKLTVVNAPKVNAVRDGKVVPIAVNELVMNDVMDLLPGQQIVADSIVLAGANLEVDESLLTGEADPIVKQPGDELLSGSFVVAGNGRAEVNKVGADAYAAQLAEEARKFTLVHSELRASIDRIVTLVTWALVPTGIGLFISQLGREDEGIRDGLVSAVGGVVAMVPEGLILLTSVAFTVGVVRLARKRTLVQELPAIEVLARVDVICIDKTGTITSGAMSLADLELFGDDGPAQDEVEAALAALAWSDPNPNATQKALQARFDAAPGWETTASVAFSSARKWSASSFKVTATGTDNGTGSGTGSGSGKGTWVFGAPEMVLAGDAYGEISDRVDAAADAGKRVLLLASTTAALSGETLPGDLMPAALVMLEDQVRPDAQETLSFFAAQGVTLKVISGDNPRTVSAVGMRVGLEGAENLIDARSLPTEQNELADVIDGATVFGRVTPHQKRAMVQALQSRGHVVAMTGDGVNDVLALKDSDCGIAMASGSEATRAVAQLVLLDSTFSSLPSVLSEGRRVINNIERVASLFLVKTTYALFFATGTIFSGAAFPFLPRHLTLVGTFTIGAPAFFLALAPNDSPVRTGFLGRVLRIALPGGLLASMSTFVAYTIARHTGGLSLAQERTTATIVLAASAILILARVAKPLVMWKIILIGAMTAFLALTLIVDPLRNYFELVDPPSRTLTMMAIVITATGVLLPFVWRLGDRAVAWGERVLHRRRQARADLPAVRQRFDK